MAANHFIFLQRHIDEDKRRLSEAIDYYVAMRRNYQVGELMHPFELQFAIKDR